MDRQLIKIGLWSVVISCVTWATVVAQNQGFQELRGSWQVIELVDNGRVIPAEAIAGWLPSGGRMEFVDNTIFFTSPKDGQRRADCIICVSGCVLSCAIITINAISNLKTRHDRVAWAIVNGTRVVIASTGPCGIVGASPKSSKDLRYRTCTEFARREPTASWFSSHPVVI